MAIPTQDPRLAAWSTNWETRVSASPTTFNLTAAQATAYTALHDAFIEAYDAVSTPGARSKSLVAAKDTAKLELLKYGRELYAYVQASLSVSNADKELVGVTVRKTVLTPVGPPTGAPVVEVMSRLGTSVTLKLHDGTGSRRGRPIGVSGASVFSHVGPNPPVNVEDWVFQGNSTKTRVTAVFPPETPAGTVVYFTAFWYSPTAQSGPGCQPVSAVIAGGAMQQSV